MRFIFGSKKIDFGLIGGIVFVLLLYWIVLFLRLPYQIYPPFRAYSFELFLLVLIVYFLIYRLPGRIGIILGLGFTLILLALTLANMWQSGYSDNFIIGGLLPYKDAKNYYFGTNLLLNGFPLEKAGQATERPLFPGFLSSLLLLTGNNLKLSLAILVQLAGIGLFYSSLRMFRALGAISASLYSALLFFYIQPWVGYTMSEVFGFASGCFAFSLLWFAAKNRQWSDLLIGLVVLLIAVSARAGTFLIFPALIIWTGWAFRQEKRFSIRASIYTLLIFIIAYLFVNTIYAKLIGVPEGSSFRNFAFALYGQVRGGIGWHSAIEILGTTDPTKVYKAAFDFFQKHPFSLVIASVKSYRDFFLPGFPNIFPFDVYGQPIWLTYTMWLVIMGSICNGLYFLIKSVHQDLPSFILAGFIGFLLSIPFLPPIDGGARFYASTVPFFFVVPAIGLAKAGNFELDSISSHVGRTLLRYFSGVLIFLTIVMPVLIFFLSNNTIDSSNLCSAGQEAYVIKISPNSYLNFRQRDQSTCGMAPDVCLADFMNNNSELKIDDFYQKIYSLIDLSELQVRLIPTINLLDGRFHYFFTDSLKLPETVNGIFSGCATEIRTKNQSIYLIETLLLNE